MFRRNVRGISPEFHESCRFIKINRKLQKVFEINLKFQHDRKLHCGRVGKIAFWSIPAKLIDNRCRITVDTAEYGAYKISPRWVPHASAGLVSLFLSLCFLLASCVLCSGEVDLVLLAKRSSEALYPCLRFSLLLTCSPSLPLHFYLFHLRLLVSFTLSLSLASLHPSYTLTMHLE